jgi:probable rRNA maturation factor
VPELRVAFRWQGRPRRGQTGELRALATAALRRLGTDAAEVGVLLCDDSTIRSLNREFRARDAATDVLSFPASFAQADGPPYLGDIAISLETAARQAASSGSARDAEVKTLLLHGILHLAGFDHETDDGEMAALESRLRRELIR